MADNLLNDDVDDRDRGPKNLLLVSWYFPPANAVAAIRLGKMAHYLGESGHRLRVVTPDQQAADRSLPIEIDEQAIIRTRYLDLDRRLAPKPSPNAGTTGDSQADLPPVWRRPLVAARRLLGKLYRDVVLYPDRRIDWTFTLLPALFREIKEKRPDLLLVSGPPFSSFIATALAAWWFDIPWMAEFRDRWADDPYGEERSRWRRWIDQRVERLLVQRAAAIVTVSDIWTRFYAGKYGLPTETVMNGFDPKDFNLDLQPEVGLPLTLLHAGTIYPGRRDPAALFEAIERHDFSPDELRVRFYGHQLGTIEEQAERFGVRDFVDLKKAVPYSEALELQKRADILLLLQWNDPADEGNVPAKVFEYFATNRPILGLGPVRGVPARLVRERKAGIYSNNPDEIARQLKSWIAEKRNSGQVAKPGPEAAKGLERQAQYRTLERFCRAVIADDGEQRPKTRKAGSAIAATLKSPCFAEVDPSSFQRPTLTVIIDTEADFDWHAPFSRDDHGTTSVLHQSRAQRLFDRFGIKPTYLIDYPVATDPAASAVLRDFVDQGKADVGIQLHPWTSPPFDELLSIRNSYPSGLPKPLQHAKIERLIEAVRTHIGIEPKVFKAGRYGFNDDTADLLETFGLEIDTSVVPFTDFSPVQGPDFQDSPHRPFWFGRNRSLLELPVTRNLCGLFGGHIGPSLLPYLQSRLGVACHLPGILARTGLLDRLTLTPEGIDLQDLKRLTRTLIRRGETLFTFVFHSPSLASGNTPYVRNDEELQAFLGRIEAYLRFFTEELGGEGQSALEIRNRLLGQPTAIGLTPTTLPSFPRTTIQPPKKTGKQPSSIGQHPIGETPNGHAAPNNPPPTTSPKEPTGAGGGSKVWDVGGC